MSQCRDYEQEDLDYIQFLKIHYENWKHAAIDAVMSGISEASLYRKICSLIKYELDNEKEWYGRFYKHSREHGTSIRLFETNRESPSC